MNVRAPKNTLAEKNGLGIFFEPQKIWRLPRAETPLRLSKVRVGGTRRDLTYFAKDLSWSSLVGTV